jgi:hypothetical protein
MKSARESSNFLADLNSLKYMSPKIIKTIGTEQLTAVSRLSVGFITGRRKTRI